MMLGRCLSPSNCHLYRFPFQVDPPLPPPFLQVHFLTPLSQVGRISSQSSVTSPRIESHWLAQVVCPSLSQSLQPKEESALVGLVWVSCPALDLEVGSASSHPCGLRRGWGSSPKENWSDCARRRGLGAGQPKQQVSLHWTSKGLNNENRKLSINTATLLPCVACAASFAPSWGRPRCLNQPCHFDYFKLV